MTVAKLFPFKPSLPEVSHEPRLVDLDDETADDVFGALSSDTARAVLMRLYEEPATASDVAEAVDTSLQNARYHLDKLMAANLVEDVDTWYSSRGTEMTVYAPTNEPLVVAAGREESKSVLREALARVLGAVAVLAVASAVVDRVARTFEGGPSMFAARGGADGAAVEDGATSPEFEAARSGDGGAGGGANATSVPEPTPEPTPTATPDDGIGIAEAPPPGNATETATRVVEATRTPAETVVTAQTAQPTPEAMASTPRPTTAAAMADGGIVEPAVSAIPPGAVFFAGGLLVILLAAGWWYLARYRPMYG